MAKNPTKPTHNVRGRPPRGWKATFLESLREVPNIRVACHKAQVDRSTVYEHKSKDPEFSDAWEEAIQDALDLCELEVHRRGARGNERPVYFQGTQVGTVREYSDNLLMFYLKGYRPERFRDNFDLSRLIEELRGLNMGDPQPLNGRKVSH